MPAGASAAAAEVSGGGAGEESRAVPRVSSAAAVLLSAVARASDCWRCHSSQFSSVTERSRVGGGGGTGTARGGCSRHAGIPQRTFLPFSTTQHSVLLADLGEMKSRSGEWAGNPAAAAASRGWPRRPGEATRLGPLEPPGGRTRRGGVRAAPPGALAVAARPPSLYSPAACSAVIPRTSRLLLRVKVAGPAPVRAGPRECPRGGGGGVGTRQAAPAAPRLPERGAMPAGAGRAARAGSTLAPAAAAAAPGGTNPRSSRWPRSTSASTCPCRVRVERGAGQSHSKHLKLEVLTQVHERHAGFVHCHESPSASRRGIPLP